MLQRASTSALEIFLFSHSFTISGKSSGVSLTGLPIWTPRALAAAMPSAWRYLMLCTFWRYVRFRQRDKLAVFVLICAGYPSIAVHLVLRFPHVFTPADCTHNPGRTRASYCGNKKTARSGRNEAAEIRIPQKRKNPSRPLKKGAGMLFFPGPVL